MRKAAFVYEKTQSMHVLRDDHVFKPSRFARRARSSE